MPIIDRVEITAYAHCSAQLTDGEIALDSGGVPSGEARCEGYRQQQVSGILETVHFTYRDGHAGAGSDPMDAVVADMTERTVARVLFADEADRPCPHCGSPRELSDQQRPTYSSLGGARGGPDVIFQDRRARRQQVEAQQASASAAERQAVALEALAAGANGGEVAALRAEIAELREQLADGNGHEPEQPPGDVAPRPRKRSPA